MYEIYLTQTSADSAHPKRVVDVIDVEGPAEANDICNALQPYLRDGIEAHCQRQTEATLAAWANGDDV